MNRHTKEKNTPATNDHEEIPLCSIDCVAKDLKDGMAKPYVTKSIEDVKAIAAKSRAVISNGSGATTSLNEPNGVKKPHQFK